MSLTTSPSSESRKGDTSGVSTDSVSDTISSISRYSGGSKKLWSSCSGEAVGETSIRLWSMFSSRESIMAESSSTSSSSSTTQSRGMFGGTSGPNGLEFSIIKFHLIGI
ncbi:hypothetical protein Tco_1149997 [Tanacetum coccineum]